MKLFERFAGFVRSLKRSPCDDPEGHEIWDDGRKFDLTLDKPTQALVQTMQDKFDGIAQGLNDLIPAENRIGGRSFHAYVAAHRLWTGEAIIDIHVGLWTPDELNAARFCLSPAQGDVHFSKNIHAETGIAHGQVSERMFDYFLVLDDVGQGDTPRYVTVLPRRDTDPAYERPVGFDDLPVPNRTAINLQGYDQDEIIYRGLFDTFEIGELSNARILDAEQLKTALIAAAPVAVATALPSLKPARPAISYSL